MIISSELLDPPKILMFLSYHKAHTQLVKLPCYAVCKIGVNTPPLNECPPLVLVSIHQHEDATIMGCIELNDQDMFRHSMNDISHVQVQLQVDPW